MVVANPRAKIGTDQTPDRTRMLASLLTEQRNPASAAIDRLATEEMLRIINAEDAKVAAAVGAAIPKIAALIDGAAARMTAGGRLFYVGAGTSGRLGVLDASECPPTFSVSPELVQGIIAGGDAALSRSTEATEDDATQGASDLVSRGLGRSDTVVGIAASGRTPYVLGAVRKAAESGALTGGISCSPGSELSAAVGIPIELLVGPEVITGSTRLKAGTATKLALNMISTGVMIRLGHVYGNLMVNVQPSNEKLRDRAARIIAAAAEISTDRAACLLAEGGSVKAAIVMAVKGLGREDAQRLLAGANGVLAKALAAATD
jgi:N-acetylmuramic acid 6-phosphate etherase